MTDLVWLALVTAGFLVLPSTARPTLPFGVRVPRERSGELRRVRTGYRVVVAVLGAAAVAATLAGATGLVPVLVVACLLAHWAAAAFVARAKRSWPKVRQGVTADTGLRTDPVRLPWSWLAPASVLLAATAVLGLVRRPPWDAAWPVTHQAVVLVIAVLAAVTLPRARPELDAARPESSARSYRAYLTGTLRIVALLATSVIAALAVKALPLWGVVAPGAVWTAVTVVLVAVPFVVAVVWLLRAGDAGHRLDSGGSEDTGVAQRDDDRHWHVGGLVYANRADPALLVHQRVGSRWTLNLGHPASWLALAALLVVVLLAG
ncbi:Uncharacterized membrane protein [Lentzea xinjiangensis]|uniref:Uncharacterized membrane protein n=1 Tax=Lentzea xinjiangensis TaxID=402600 RepID=A0A1H9R9C0_9PSEU|nr:DUF5808 domain-containing protein [Lentzea xinjiangensis]SER69135.1 Uncharacterized membrane protein [Lentzea xinjiangensis]